MTNVRKFLSTTLLIAYGILHGVFFWVSSWYATPPIDTPPGKSPLMSTSFTLEIGGIDPTTKPYTQGSDNIPEFLKRVTRILLIVISTFAVLSIVIGGFYMATSGGDSEKANKGKIIITYNIIAIFVALFSYGIIQFVIWIIWA